MDLGNHDSTDILIKLLQFSGVVVTGVFAYFGKKVLNDVSKLKVTKADILYVDKENCKQKEELERRLAEKDRINQLILEDLRYIRARVDNIPIKNNQ